jgi:hypothetical protein
MLDYLLSAPSSFYGYAAGAMMLAFGLVQLGHRVLNLLRDYRDFREGY